MKKIIVFIILWFSCTTAQIDTTVWYPLQIGNIWQYSYYVSISESFYLTFEVVGDTLINGKTFYKIKNNDKYQYQRLENNEKVWEYNTFSGHEYVRYDFVSPDRSIWNIDPIGKQYGIYQTFPDVVSIYGDTSISKVFNNVYIKTSSTKPDTIWSSMADGLAIVVTKGLGITEYGQGINQCSFVGAKINGCKLGVLTNVEESPELSASIKLNQNYPNPFNPSTVIEFYIPESGFVELLLYNSLGEKVDELLNRNLLRGSHQITFDGSNLPSGVYFYVLRTTNYFNAKKMLLVK
ncbi:MAG: T9SS type A sorting domain-containing protein [Melioribacteraceae bacterium]